MIAIVLLVGAIARNPYDYYIILRYVVCTTALCGTWFAYKLRKYVWLGVFILAAILFNPFIPIHLKRQAWLYIDIAIALVFLSSFIFLKIKTEKKPAEVIEKKKDERDRVNNEKRPDRESDLWKKPLSINELENTRDYVASELRVMKTTDWADYALRAICTHSPNLSKLMVNDQLDISFIKESERTGIANAINAIKKVRLTNAMTVREFFSRIFETIYKETSYSKGNKFYWFGRDRVIQMLRSFTVSTGRFTPIDAKFYDVDGEEFKLDANIDSTVIEKVRQSLNYFEKQAERHREIERLKDYYRFQIDSEYPVIEFDLAAIEKTGIFGHEGSLVNSLYLEMRNLLHVVTDYAYLESRVFSHPLFDGEAASFAYGAGIVILVKYAGLVEYFPDRLYVELQDIDQNSWVANWIKSHKLHLEGND
jgi:hypothetical protein